MTAPQKGTLNLCKPQSYFLAHMAIPLDITSSLNKLSLSTDGSKSPAPKTHRSPIADTWEDDDLSSGSETDRPLSAQGSRDYPNAPPPTPISPTSPATNRHRDTFATPLAESWNQDTASPGIPERDEARRPEKSVSTASRMIAMGLGQKVPKKTEEQRAYDRAVREKEIRRRNAEKEEKRKAEEDATRAKAAIWED